MKFAAKVLVSAAALAASVSLAATSFAADKVRIAGSQQGNWSTAMPVWGQTQGFFKAENLDVEVVWTAGGSDAQQAIISGAADVALQTGTLGVIAAYVKGAPIRVIGASMTGSGGLFWYVKAASPIKTLKDAGPNTTVAFSRPGSSTNLVAAALLKHHNSPAKLVSAGSVTATMTQVMSGQIDIGWTSPPTGLDKLKAGEIRVVAEGDEVPSVREQTIRVHAANANWMKKNPDVALRLMRALWKAHEYAYTQKGMEEYVKYGKLPIELVEQVAKYAPLKAHSFWPVGGMDQTMQEAIEAKRIKKPLTKAQLDDLIQVVYKPNVK